MEDEVYLDACVPKHVMKNLQWRENQQLWAQRLLSKMGVESAALNRKINLGAV